MGISRRNRHARGENSAAFSINLPRAVLLSVDLNYKASSLGGTHVAGDTELLGFIETIFFDVDLR
jgi:hypothetical protein